MRFLLLSSHFPKQSHADGAGLGALAPCGILLFSRVRPATVFGSLSLRLRLSNETRPCALLQGQHAAHVGPGQGALHLHRQAGGGGGGRGVLRRGWRRALRAARRLPRQHAQRGGRPRRAVHAGPPPSRVVCGLGPGRPPAHRRRGWEPAPVGRSSKLLLWGERLSVFSCFSDSPPAKKATKVLARAVASCPCMPARMAAPLHAAAGPPR